MEEEKENNNDKKDNLIQNITENEEDDMAILKQSQSSSTASPNNEQKGYIVEALPKNHTQYDKSIKVILLGDSNVGKTSILNCLEHKDILDRKTISLEYFNYNIKINNYVIRMQIWDTVGQEKFNSITANYYKTTDVAIFVYAINDLTSFKNIETWFNELNDKGTTNTNTNTNNNNNNNTEDINDRIMLKVLVGNKKDLIKERKVTYQMGLKLQKEKNFYLFKEVSCHDDDKSEAILDENSLGSNNENVNLNIEQMNENEQNNEDIKDSVKNLFNEIAKILYKELIEENGSRFNASMYYYEASKSFMDLDPDKTDADTEGKPLPKKKKRCCC